MKQKSDAELFNIEPHRMYRKHSKETRAIIGLGETAMNEAINDGTLPPPVPLTKKGKACGWLGWQLIEITKQRLARAPARQANPPTSANLPARGTKKTKTAKKRRGRAAP